MSSPVFIGDELTASGFRLGGAEVRVADDENIEAAFDDAMATTDLVLVSAHSANLLPPDKLSKALRAPQPLVIVVPDALNTRLPDLTQYVRRTLDLE
jgi:vacuolar-type H+-ATPase subunit F/Vma7